MIKKHWEQILLNQEVRQNLSKIRQELKTASNKPAFLYALAGEEERLISLLQSEDAKTRKNTALLMGDLGKQEFLAPIFGAYEKETQQFVKSAYLSAIKNFDYQFYMEQLKDRLQILIKEQPTEENQKHHMEEIRELTALIIQTEGVKTHPFIGWNETFDVILLTGRGYASLAQKELLQCVPDAETKLVGAGVLARVNHLNWIRNIRIYQELLFMVDGMKSCEMDPEMVAETVVNSDLISFLEKNHFGETPFYFRVELKSKSPLDVKSNFVKKVSGQIEKKSERKLVNTTSDYEIEIRIIENKEGNCNLLVKLYTINEERFSYRKEVMPTSIKPVNAALTVALSKEYMKEGAKVLDPFCGVGTMLIERHKAVAANTTYGIDKQEEAIQKAKINTETAHQIIHYINRDFFTFQHEYLFDEVITNMPFKIGRTTEEEIYEIYQEFFSKIANHLTEEGLIILYSHNRDWVQKLAISNYFTILQEFEISRREETFVFVLRV